MSDHDSKNLIDEKTKDPLLDHDYDGIKELDNPLPGWWLMTFYIAIVFSVFYVGYYEFGSGESINQEFSKDVASIQKPKSEEKTDSISEEKLLSLVSDSTQIELGKKSFTQNCASCHGNNLEGGIGPNLVDKYWIHGDGSLVSVLNTVNKGVLEKGMPPWEGVIRPNEREAIVAYIRSLEGSSPANAKAPQGELKR